MTQRSIPISTRQDLEGAWSEDALICFLTITNSQLPDPIRVACDTLDYTWGGELYQGVLFDFAVLTDDDETPYTELIMPNTDRRIGNAVRATVERPKVDLALISAADFDLSVNPRTELATPEVVYGFSDFEISEVSVDVAEVRARVIMRDYSTEPFPGISATESRFPGLFR